MLALLSEPSFLEGFFSDWPYAAPFLVLFLCGLGLPLPEEVTLIGSGLLVYQGHAGFLPMVLVCSTAILLGDTVPFWIGRRYGMSVLRLRWVARVLHPERFQRMERRFEEHGNWAVFVCRFMPGLRIPGYFVAGMMGMGYPRFMLLDGLGVLISVPLSIFLGKLFGGSVDRAKAALGDLHMLLAFLLVSVLITVWVRRRQQRRRLTALAREMASAAPRPEPGRFEPGPGGPDGHREQRED